MRHFFVVCILISLLLGCKKETTPLNSSILSYIPHNAAAIVKVNNFQTLKSSLKNNAFILETINTKTFKKLNNKLSALQYVKPNTTGLIAFVEEGNNNVEVIFVTENDSVLTNLESAQNKTIETLSYSDHSYKKFALNKTVFYSTKLNNINILSSSKLLIENSIRIKEKNIVNTTFSKLYNASKTNKAATLFINLEQNNQFLNVLLNTNSNKLTDFADWLALDIAASQNELLLSGVAVASDSIKKFTNNFKKTTPTQNHVANVAPITSNGFTSFNFTSFSAFFSNTQSNNNIALLDSVKQNGFESINEIGLVSFNNGNAISFYAEFSEELRDFFKNLELNSTEFSQTTIYTLAESNLLTKATRLIDASFTPKYYCVIDNFYILAERTEILQNIITNNSTNATLKNSNQYNNQIKQLADESSLLTIRFGNAIKDYINASNSDAFKEDFKSVNLKNYTLALQLIADNNFNHLHLSITKNKPKSQVGTVAQLFSVQLDAAIATQPQFVINHRTQKKEIVVQDVENNLYLIATDGKVLWKKQLDSKIQGKIHQVDIYKNGRLQLAFTTASKFLIIDRNGNIVEPFNKQFSGLLLPLAVFDYDKNKDYRFVIVSGQNIYMYNRKGQIVKGFTFTKSDSEIIKRPEHFRIGSKDYLVFAQKNGALQILNRRGQKRIKVNRKFSFSENNIYLYKNKFTFTNSKGQLVQIDSKGGINVISIGVEPEHYIDATTKTLVTLSNNLLSIKGKKIELDYGFYSAPKIFYIYDKIYVAVTDIQNQKVYLFDSQAKNIKNFPVYGTEIIDLSDIDNDRHLELVTKAQDNTILVYKIN